MSGIAGTYHLDGQPAGAAELSRMTETLAHRGPDGINHRCEGLVGLAHLMLHATPEALHETLPEAAVEDHFRTAIEADDPRIRRWVEDPSFRVDDPVWVRGLFRLLGFTVAAREELFEPAGASGLYESSQDLLVDVVVDGLFED